MTSFTSHWGSGATMWVSICPLLNPVSNDSVNEQHRFRITDRAAGFSLLITSSEGQLMRRRLNKEKSWDTERWMNISSARLCHISSDRLQCEPITFFLRVCQRRAARIHLCACWPGSSSTQWAPRRGEALFAAAHLFSISSSLFQSASEPVGALNYSPQTLSLRLDKLQKGFLAYRHLRLSLISQLPRTKRVGLFFFFFFRVF